MSIRDQILGGHVVLFSHDADADRAFIRDTLGFSNVDAGGGWLIFALPPSEVAVHPEEGEAPDGAHDIRAELYLMTEDLDALVGALAERGVPCGDVMEAGWGRLVAVTLPSGGEIGLYQPLHPTALELA